MNLPSECPPTSRFGIFHEERERERDIGGGSLPLASARLWRSSATPSAGLCPATPRAPLAGCVRIDFSLAGGRFFSFGEALQYVNNRFWCGVPQTVFVFDALKKRTAILRIPN
jgi:hypothetical protein